MDKNILKICFIAALLVSAGSVYAATDITGATQIGGGTFSPSNKVNIQAKATSVNYSAESKHLSGDRIYGTNNVDPKIHYTSGVVGSAATAPGSETVDYTNWTTL